MRAFAMLIADDVVPILRNPTVQSSADRNDRTHTEEPAQQSVSGGLTQREGDGRETAQFAPRFGNQSNFFHAGRSSHGGREGALRITPAWNRTDIFRCVPLF